MIPVASLADKQVAVFGLGASGRAAATALAAGGADVVAWDEDCAAVAAAEAIGIKTVDFHDIAWETFACLVLAPGVPLTHPEPHWTVRKAQVAEIEIIGDVELFCRERRRLAPQAPFIAVTGTNGKSTTTELIGHLLRSTGHDVQIGGNIGTPVLSLDPPAIGRFHVIECSSFQIDLTPTLDPSVGVLLNVTADHVDRHGTIEAYAAIKERLVANADVAIVVVDDPWCHAIADRLAIAGKTVLRVSTRRPIAHGVYAEGTELFYADDRIARPVASLKGIGSLRGRHNAENAAATFGAGRALKIEDVALAESLKSFPGLPHRMEEVGRRGRVLFVNDSKATNADAAAKALASFHRIFWIAGGRAKDGGISGLVEFFPRIAKAYLIGESADDFAKMLDGAAEYEISRNLADAVTSATADADRDQADEPVVLLSPACASYDQFQNFEHRGDLFRQLVAALDGVETRGEAA